MRKQIQKDAQKFLTLALCVMLMLFNINTLAVSDSYENVTAAVRKAETLLEKINSSGWNTLGETMVSESAFLGLSSEIGEFSRFGEAAQNEIANYMASDMPFGDFKEIKASLINAIKKYNDNRRKNESGSGGGSGSGGSGKSISVTPVTPVITNPSTPQKEYRFADLAARSMDVQMLTPNPDDNEEASALDTEIRTYVEENTMKFVNGTRPIGEFDKFVDTLKKMNVERYIEIYQNAYNNYINVY